MPHRQNYTHAQITEQVEKISRSPTFSNSPVLCQFLRFVVNETLAGSGERIKEYTIGTQVLGRKSDFDPQLDAIVRIHAGRLRRALNEFYLEEGKIDPLVISIPKGGYAPNFTKKERENNSAEPSIARKADKIKKPALAVMPFRNLSNDAAHDFFCYGLGEFVSTELARFPELSLVSYSLCESIAHKTKDTGEIVSALGAHYLLTGSVSIGHENLRIYLQLSVGDSGRQLWSSSINRRFVKENSFEIEEEVVNIVTASLGGYYGIIYRNEYDESRTEANHPERSVIVWYYQFMKQLDKDIFDQASGALEIVLKTDPDFSLAWAVLSEIYAIGALRGFQRVDHQMEIAITFAIRALKLDPQSQHAYQSLAFVSLITRDKVRFLQAAEKCIALNSRNAGFSARIGMFLILAGESEHGEKLLSASLQVNPFSSWLASFALCLYYYKRGEYQRAMNYAESVDMPGIGWTHMLKAASQAQLGRYELARESISQFVKLIPNIKEQGRSFVSRILLDEDLIDKLIVGLEKAGLFFEKERQFSASSITNTYHI